MADHEKFGQSSGGGDYTKVPDYADCENEVSRVDAFEAQYGIPAGSPASPYRGPRLGVAKILATLHHKDMIEIEKSSVYGSALAIPQLARSAGWPLDLTMLALRSYFFLVTNIILQGLCLYMIDKSEEVIDKFAGQMYLCDFGAGVRGCPDGPGCTGPGGTLYTPARLYSFDTWTSRSFIRDSISVLFPDMQSTIMQEVDPGEYGQESHCARFLCCFLFMASLMSELTSIHNTFRICASIPTSDDSWISSDSSDQSHHTEVRLKVAGLPCCWKFLNFLFICVPKLVLWRLTASAGMNFLLDTAGITEVIVNTVALHFIIDIDELLFESVTTKETRFIMNKLEGFNTFGERLSADEEHLFFEAEVERGHRCSIKMALPLRLMLTLLLTVIFVSEYYTMNCQPGSGGVFYGFWKSQSVILPESMDYPLLSFLLPSIFPQPVAGDEPYWSMPSQGSTGQNTTIDV